MEVFFVVQNLFFACICHGLIIFAQCAVHMCVIDIHASRCLFCNSLVVSKADRTVLDFSPYVQFCMYGIPLSIN